MDLQEVTFSCVMRRNGGAPAQEFIPTPGAGDLPSGKFNARRCRHMHVRREVGLELFVESSDEVGADCGTGHVGTILV